MSYNIDTCEVIGEGTLTISGANIKKILRKHGNELPEDNFFAGFAGELQTAADYPIDQPTWRGEGSGRGYETLIKHVLPSTMGSADVVFTWEGGGLLAGLRIRDGVVTRHKVEMALGDELKPRT